MCGIWAIVNQEPEAFDYQSFCTLGCANDVRGGDSCGVFIDGQVEYGIGQKARFESFFWGSELLNNTEIATIALGHDRKASVGGISLEKAHPIIIKEPVKVAEGEEPREEIKFVMVHNGTIYNYEELAKKYIPDIDIKDMSDSQVLARLIYYSGYDFLAEYNGGAAFIAVDYRGKEPKVILWRGESKKYSTYGQMEEERPLFCNTQNGRLVVSSICSYLAIVDGNCFTVPANTVLRYHKDSLWIIKKIDRSKAQQIKEYKYEPPTNNYNRNYNAGVAHYVHPVPATNTYKIDLNNAMGYHRLSAFGRLIGNHDSYTATEDGYQVFFFDGIALQERAAFIFLCKAHKRTRLTLPEFTEKYQNFIRYFSVDRLYPVNGLMYEAIEPFEKKLYTGYLQQLTETVANYFAAGKETTSFRNQGAHSAFEALKEDRKYDYKAIWKQFIQSMG